MINIEDEYTKNNILHIILGKFYSNKLELIKLLVKHKININAYDNNNQTPLDVAITSFHQTELNDKINMIKIIQYLIKNGAISNDYNTEDTLNFIQEYQRIYQDTPQEVQLKKQIQSLEHKTPFQKEKQQIIKKLRQQEQEIERAKREFSSQLRHIYGIDNS